MRLVYMREGWSMCCMCTVCSVLLTLRCGCETRIIESSKCEGEPPPRSPLSTTFRTASNSPPTELCPSCASSHCGLALITCNADIYCHKLDYLDGRR